MTSDHTTARSTAAKQVYEQNLRHLLEGEHDGRFVAIDPESGEYFLGTSFVEAAMLAREQHPSRLPFVIRIGYPTANHIGAAR